MKNHRWIVLTGGIGIAAALLLHAAKTDGITVVTGSKAFTNTASLSPGLARRITAQDLPQPMVPAGSVLNLRTFTHSGIPGMEPCRKARVRLTG